ncbi:MAG: serine-type D-Ala-D-Ala carboxypeptidase [Nitrospirales bacterium]|nr:MAG: serine-type D-Ala-D-Ala carboxypeptidase [Nitrospirales bacterium]
MIPIAIISVVIFPPWDGIWAWLAPLPDTVQEQVDDAVNHGLDGIIVYVDEPGQAPQFYASGWKDRDNRIPADPQSLFKIGSIYKLYVAVATAKMINEQRLSLDDTLADHFPELVGRIENAETITLRQLVQHRSGIPNYTDDPDFNWADPPKSNTEMLELVLDMPADFEPDSKYSYSNTNYLLIRNILDNVLGYSHLQYIEERILLPLELKNTFGSLDEVDIDDVMSGYGAGLEPDFKHIDFGMLATAEDVGIFLRALNDGSLLDADEQAIYSSIYEYGHKGWVLGYHSIARYHEDIDTVVIQFVNTTLGDTELTTIVVYNRIVRILRG